jgi:hypothetical protein
MVDATRRWLAGQDARVKRYSRGSLPPKVMAPWDENAYFQAVRETTSVGGALQQLATADPMRVAIIFSLAGGAAAVIATSRDLAGSSGIALGSNSPIFAITQQQYGNLCQSEWWAVPGPGITISIFEVRLRDWPQ